MVSLMARQCPVDGALVDQVTHWEVPLISGRPITSEVAEPIEFEIDLDSEGRRMPTFFTTPAFLVKNSFYQDLLSFGVDNLQAYRATITNTETGECWNDYRVLNVVGLIECADVSASDVSRLGPDLLFFNSVTVDKDALPGDLLVFRLGEDPTKIIVADRTVTAIQDKGYDDIYFEKLD